MQLVGVQIDIVWENRDANLAKVAAMLEQRPPARGAIVALPEMFAAGFSMNVPAIADRDGVVEKFVCELAKKYGVYVIAGNVALGRDAQATLGTNVALVAGPDGSVVTRYSKIHPYAPGQEKKHYAAGDEIVTFRAGEFTVAPFICYDLRFPEIFRIATARGANVLVNIASWPSARAEHWTALLKARAIENQAYVLGVNRCGLDPNFPYPGKSVIYDPRGKVLAEAGEGEEIIAAEADFNAMSEYRKQLPFLADARAEFLGSD